LSIRKGVIGEVDTDCRYFHMFILGDEICNHPDTENHMCNLNHCPKEKK